MALDLQHTHFCDTWATVEPILNDNLLIFRLLHLILVTVYNVNYMYRYSSQLPLWMSLHCLIVLMCR